jgi:hypothetical protein
MQELEKPAEMRLKMFRKTMPLIEKFHRKWLQHDNQRKTLRQAVPLDTGEGAVQSFLASHYVQELRKKLQEESKKVRPPAVGAPVQSRKRARNDNNDNARLPLPPAEVSQARRNPGVMESVAREAHTSCFLQ